MASLMDLINQKKAALSSGNRAKTVKPPEGRSRWRILPTWRKTAGDQFWHDFGQHFIKDATGTLKAVYVCADKTYGRPCNVCDGIAQAMHATTDDAMVELMKEAKASGRVLMNALQISGAKPDEPEILELSPNTFSAFLGVIQEWGDQVLSLEEGMDVIIERTGKGLQTKYTVQAASKSKPAPAGVMAKVTDLDEYVKQESAEQEKRALANLSAVAGLLTATGSAAKPSLSTVVDDERDGTNDIGMEPATKPAASPLAAAAAAATDAVVSSASSGDPDLDAMLAGLGA